MKINGTITDKNNVKISDADVILLSSNFELLYSYKSDENGNFEIDNDINAKYLACVKDYGKTYLEYWYNNINQRISNDPIEISFDKIEIYGLNAFKVNGAPFPLMIYFRPMSLTKFLNSEKNICPCVEADNLDISIDGIKTKIMTVNKVKEATNDSGESMDSFLINVDLPKELKNKSQVEIRVKYSRENEMGMADLYVDL